MSGTVVIAQARMSSTRLPGKVMAELAGSAVVDHVVRRAERATRVDEVWVATTTDPSDDPLATHLEALGVPYMRGSLDDVLDRYVATAGLADAETVVRITCDCPLIDPDVIDTVLAGFWHSPGVDYCSNTLRRTYPVGMDVEVFSRAALERAAAQATRTDQREHVTPYFYQHPDLFLLRNVEAPDDLVWPELRLTLDEPADLEMLSELTRFVSPDASLGELLRVLRSEPRIAEINAAVEHRYLDGSPER